MTSKNNKKPNIIFILADDMGAWAMRCAGNSEIYTPNLDRLALAGIRFTNFFCSSPVCSPARASILTGRIPSQHGVHDWIRSGNIDITKLPNDIKSNKVFKDEKKPIEYLKDQLAYTDVLSNNDYVCGLSGKWHLGDSVRPQKSFSHWFTIARGGCNYCTPDVVKDGEVHIENRYITDLITEDALEFMEEQRYDDKPFYLSVHYTAPHSPWDNNQHPKKFIDYYSDCPFKSCPEERKHEWQVDTIPWGTGEKRKEILRGYYAAVTAMDNGIGRILDKVEEMNIREDTLIVFTSDNGMNMGHHGIFGKGNGTFPMNMYDTAVKVPAIISHPGRIAQGVVCDELLSHYDFMPTLLDYLNIRNTEIAKLPGKSFALILEGREEKVRENVVIFDEYGPVRMIRTKEWKYIHRYPYGPHELYNLVDDPDEKVNLLLKEGFNDEIVEKLTIQLEEWFAQYVNPYIDGAKESVFGGGQLNLAGLYGKGKKTYVPNKKETYS